MTRCSMMTRYLLLLLLCGCTGFSDSVKHYTRAIGDKVCDTKETVTQGVQAPLDALLPSFVAKPIGGSVDLLLTFICKTFHLGASAAGEVVGGVVDPVTTITNIVDPAPVTPAIAITLPTEPTVGGMLPFPGDGSSVGPVEPGSEPLDIHGDH